MKSRRKIIDEPKISKNSCDIVAKELKECMDSFVNAGFTREESVDFLTTILKITLGR